MRWCLPQRMCHSGATCGSPKQALRLLASVLQAASPRAVGVARLLTPARRDTEARDLIHIIGPKDGQEIAKAEGKRPDLEFSKPIPAGECTPGGGQTPNHAKVCTSVFPGGPQSFSWCGARRRWRLGVGRRPGRGAGRLLCWGCGKQYDLSEPRLWVCGACGEARYCDEACQREHWPAHKRECLHAWTEKVEQRLSQGVSREEVQQELDDWYQNG